MLPLCVTTNMICTVDHMLRPVVVSTLLDTIVSDGSGATAGIHTAILTLPNSAELFAYAATEQNASGITYCSSLMDFIPGDPKEEHARQISALIVDAWRKEHPKRKSPVTQSRTDRRDDQLASPLTPQQRTGSLSRVMEARDDSVLLLETSVCSFLTSLVVFVLCQCACQVLRSHHVASGNLLLLRSPREAEMRRNLRVIILLLRSLNMHASQRYAHTPRS